MLTRFSNEINRLFGVMNQLLVDKDSAATREVLGGRPRQRFHALVATLEQMLATQQDVSRTASFARPCGTM